MLENALRLVMARTRPVRIPPNVRAVTVGGASAGGSGKTRVAIAVAKDLAARGERVVLVGHAYRARPGHARFVAPDDALAEVGDEAIVAARALEGIARVVVAPARQEAVDRATDGRSGATVLVFDGPLQLRPRRASLAILTVDASDPPPHASLTRHADLVLPVDSEIHDDDAAFLRGRRFGLFTAIARPWRLAGALRRRGLVPAVSVEAPDHGPIRPADGRILATAGVDVWVATPKCAVHLECGREYGEVAGRLRVLTCIDPPRARGLTLKPSP